jgi:TRAP-type mannitol/chloroaromatic compound transport system substrate-binding protein
MAGHPAFPRGSRGGGKSIDRRKFLVRSRLAAGAAAAFPAPAIARGIREFKLVTSSPKGLPGLGTSAERMARSITITSGKRIRVRVFGAGELVSAFEAFDAVSAGIADMYHSAEYYREAKAAGLSFFAPVPFGLTADEMAAWIRFGAVKRCGTNQVSVSASRACCSGPQARL